MGVLLRCIDWILISVLLVDSNCFGGEPPTQLNTPTPTPECPKKLEAVHDCENRPTVVPGSVLDRFKVATDGGLLLLPVVLQGKRYLFALHTGVTHGVYDKSLRSLLGKPLRSQTIWTPGHEVTEQVFRSSTGKVGKLTLPKDSEVLCVDMERIREVSGQEIYGFLGMDFLGQYVFRIDFDRGEVAFTRSVGPNSGERVPVTFQGNFPYVMLGVRGLPGRERFLVDTGFGGFGSGSLHTDAFATLMKQGDLTLDGEKKVETASGRGPSWLGRVKAISLGDYRHEKLLFATSNRNILGLNYWSRYVVTFDFPNGVMYLKKGREFDQPDIRDMSGLQVIRRKQQILVESVKKGSPSAQAGVNPQDVIIKINDVKTSDITLCSIRRLLCAKGKKCPVLLQRAEEKIKVTIVLQDWEKAKERK